MPVMNPQHAQMRQPYPGQYGAPQQQPMPHPVPPQQQQGGSPPGQGEDSSVNTGEGSENAAAAQQQPQQQYMPQPGYSAVPGSYPAYGHYQMPPGGRGGAPGGFQTGPGGHPQMRPAQMQVLPGAVPYGQRAMGGYPGQPQMMGHHQQQQHLGMQSAAAAQRCSMLRGVACRRFRMGTVVLLRTVDGVE